MNKGIISGINKNNRKKWYPKLVTVSQDGTGLTQPINNGTPLRNHGNWSYIDPNTVEAEWHMNHSYFSPEGVGQAYLIELPVPMRRWGGKGDETTPQLIGFGRFIDFFHNPYSEIPLAVAAADPNWFNMKNEANKYVQVYVPYRLKLLSSTWSANSSSVNIAHGLEYKPDVTDLNVKLSSAPTGYWYTNLVGQCATGITANANRFLGLTNVVGAWVTTSTGAGSYTVVPGNGRTYTIDNLYINIDVASGAGITRTFTVQKNGVDTSLTCTVSGASQVTANDPTNSFTCTSGDTIALRTSSSALTASTGVIRWSVRAKTNANSNMSLMSGSSAAHSTTATQYVPLQSYFTSATASDNEQVMPTSGTLQNAQVQLNGAPGTAGSGKSYAFTLYKNGSPTSVVITITDTATTGTYTASTVSYVQGDKFYWQVVPTGTPTARPSNISIENIPGTAGDSLHLLGNGGNSLVNSAVRYHPVSHPASSAGNATQTLRSVISQAATWKNLYVYTATATGAAKTWTIKTDVNAVAGNPQVQITNAATTGSDNSNTVTTSVGDTVSLEVTPAGTPTATLYEISLVSNIAPTVTPVDTILTTTDATNITLTAFSGNIGTNDVSVGVKVRQAANYINGGFGTMFYSPERPYHLGFPMEILLQIIYEVDI